MPDFVAATNLSARMPTVSVMTALGTHWLSKLICLAELMLYCQQFCHKTTIHTTTIFCTHWLSKLICLPSDCLHADSFAKAALGTHTDYPSLFACLAKLLILTVFATMPLLPQLLLVPTDCPSFQLKLTVFVFVLVPYDCPTFLHVKLMLPWLHLIIWPSDCPTNFACPTLVFPTIRLVPTDHPTIFANLTLIRAPFRLPCHQTPMPMLLPWLLLVPYDCPSCSAMPS